MTAFGLTCLAILLYGGVHSLLASLTVKAWAARRLGHTGQRYYRLFFVLFGSLSFLPVLGLLYIYPGARLYSIPAPWRWLALLLQAGCVFGLAASVSRTGTVQFLGLDALNQERTQMNADHLVTTGLYRWVRHPIYTFTLLLLYLMPVVTTGWLGLVVGSTIYILAAIPFEERKLVAEFGQAYRDYQARVPALIPGLKPRG